MADKVGLAALRSAETFASLGFRTRFIRGFKSYLHY